MRDQIKQLLADNPIVAAPMAGISNHATRLIAREFGCGLVFTEMISAKALCYDNPKTFQLMEMRGERQPVVMQIFGSEPETVARGARIMEAHGAQLIDINMGCPVPKVVRNGEGAALMRTPDLARAIVEATVRAVSVPVSVKIRKGWDEAHENAVDFARQMESAGASAVTVHGRTRAQYYSGAADWGAIARVKAAVRVPVIGNGDIFRPEDGKAMLRETGCDGVMLGRGALGRPWLYRQLSEYLRTGAYAPDPDRAARREIVLHHARLLCADRGEEIAMKEMRKFVAWYYKGLPHAARMRERVNSLATYAQLERLLEEEAEL